MTSLADAGDGSSTGGLRWERPTWPRVAVIVALLLFAFFVLRQCQQDQVRLTEEQAIAAAEDQVDFTPEQTQIRLLRQDIDRTPFWFVSLSRIEGEGDNERFTELAVVRINANTGEVMSVQEKNPRQGAEP